MLVCTFFGHRECYALDMGELQNAIEKLIEQGVNMFYVGHHGGFDGMVHTCLKQLQKQYPHMQYAVVLTRLPEVKGKFDDFSDTVYPEGIESVHPKYAINWRNKWMIAASDYCVCYVNHTWGGAYQFAKKAKSSGLTVINLGCATL